MHHSALLENSNGDVCEIRGERLPGGFLVCWVA